MAETRLIAWCTSVIIDAIEGDHLLSKGQLAPATWWHEIRPVYEAAERGEVALLVSAVSLAEVCKIEHFKAEGISAKQAMEMLSDFFDNDFIDLRPVDKPEAELAAELIRQRNLDTCDAVIAATAILHGAEMLLSRDGLKKRKAKKKSLVKSDGFLFDPKEPLKFLKIKAPHAKRFIDGTLADLPNDQKNLPKTIWPEAGDGEGGRECELDGGDEARTPKEEASIGLAKTGSKEEGQGSLTK